MSNWGPEQLAVLRRRWAQGWTARQIGEVVGKTRLAVLGKTNRLGIKQGVALPEPQPEPTEEQYPPLRKPSPRNGTCSHKGCRGTPQPGDLRRRCAEHIRKDITDAKNKGKPTLTPIATSENRTSLYQSASGRGRGKVT